jgi:hypothetical protein
MFILVHQTCHIISAVQVFVTGKRNDENFKKIALNVQQKDMQCRVIALAGGGQSFKIPYGSNL